MIKACIFDLDGTILYTLDSMAKPGNQVLKELGLKAHPVENYRYYCGDGPDVLVKRILEDAGDKELACYDRALPLYREYFSRDMMYGVKEMPQVRETLTDLKKRGLKLAVCSNKPQEATKAIIETFYPGIFDVVIGQSQEVPRKPAPDEAWMAAEGMGVLPEECVYIGDSGTDMLTGKAAGMYTVGVLWGYRDLDELEENGADTAVFAPEDLIRLPVLDG